jgi:hypothetical protein
MIKYLSNYFFTYQDQLLSLCSSVSFSVSLCESSFLLHRGSQRNTQRTTEIHIIVSSCFFKNPSPPLLYQNRQIPHVRRGMI